MVQYDAFLLVSFGGPEGRDDVLPFLENVLRGRNVPRERMLEVAEHYQRFGGVSPINAQNRTLLAALKTEFDAAGLNLPLYWGNRNWHPLLPDTLRKMQSEGVRRALAVFTSAFSSYSGCRQYRENIQAAREAVGPDAPRVDKVRAFYNHPGFIETMADRVREALDRVPEDRRSAAQLIFTAHSIPAAMAANCKYEEQLNEASRLTAERLGRVDFRIAYQSRSGPPTQPWLEPDVNDVLRTSAGAGVRDVIVVPIGFVSDHMEVIYDLDEEAARTARDLGLNLLRAGTAGTHPRFVRMIRELVEERIAGVVERPALGVLGPCHDVCPTDCCLPPPRSPQR